MTPIDAKRAADELIAAANKKAKARLDAAGEKRASEKLPPWDEMKASALAKSNKPAILLRAGEEQLLGPRFAGKGKTDGN